MRTGTVISLVGLVAGSLLVPPTASGQDADRFAKVPADKGPPAEVVEMQKLPRAERARQISRAHLLEVLEELEPGSTSAEKRGSGKPLPAAAGVPEEVREAQQRSRSNRGARRQGPPSKAELIEKIRSMPGGAELIEHANGRGKGLSSAPGGAGAVLSWLNPLRVPEAHASSNYSLTLTPMQPSSSSPYGFLMASGAQCCSPSFVHLQAPRSWSFDGTSTSIRAPYVNFWMQAPADGWYIVNVRGGTLRTKAKLTLGGSVLRAFDFSSRTGTQDYPTMVHLSKGYHGFYFYVTYGNLYLEQVNVYSW